jgi:hypothetical protein
MRPNPLYILAATLALGLLIGCSGAGDNAAVTPTLADAASQPKAAASVGCPQLWGIWKIAVNTADGTCEVIPLRGPTLTANVNNLLEAKPNNLLIQNLDLSDWFTEGRVNCTVTLHHPFPGLNQYHGFDVWGVFMHNGASQLNYESLTYPRGPAAMEDEGVLLNADGYTRWFNQVEFGGGGVPLLSYYPGKLADLAMPTSMLNGLKIFADGLGEEDDYYAWITTPGNADNRGIFRAGQANSRRYEMQFPMVGGTPVLTFQYAVVASWEPADPTLTGDPATYDPMDFPTTANCAEPFFVQTSTVGSSLYFKGQGQAGGTFRADLEVFDWQGGIAGHTGVLNEINRIIIEADFLPTGSAQLTQAQAAALASPGTANSSVISVEISGCTPKSSVPQEYWVIVEGAGESTDTYGQGPPPYPESRRAAFKRASVNVSTENPALSVTNIDPDVVPFWSTVTGAQITGTNFQAGASVELRKSPEPAVDATNVIVFSPTSLTCDFDLRGVDSGDWDVVVINPDDQEGVLLDGLKIDVWSEEEELITSGCRLPRMAETSADTVVLITGNDDSTMKYRTWAPTGTGFAGPYLLANTPSNDLLLGLNSDPQNDYVYLSSGPSPVYRYASGTDPWETFWDPIAWCRCSTVSADNDGRIHVWDNTNSAFGFIIQLRADYWGCPWPDGWVNAYFMDPYNDKTESYGNIVCQDSAGTQYFAYEKDRAQDPYSPQPGPRSARVGICFLGTTVSNSYYIIEETWDEHLDSPAITCDPEDVLHSAYRHYVNASGQWQVAYRRSIDGGYTWGSSSTIWSGTTEPYKGYVYLLSDSQGVLHAAYIAEGSVQYKRSADGVTWSPAETVNESSPPGGYQDITPNFVATQGDIMHAVWIRATGPTGYGALYHRMRDLE